MILSKRATCRSSEGDAYEESCKGWRIFSETSGIMSSGAILNLARRRRIRRTITCALAGPKPCNTAGNPYNAGDRSYNGVGRTYSGVGRSYNGVGRTYKGVGRSYHGVGRMYNGVGRSYNAVGRTHNGVGN